MKRSKLEKQKEASERASLRSKRSHQDQLEVLDRRLGKDTGAAKERARLKFLIENPVKKEDDSKKKKTRIKKNSSKEVSPEVSN